MKLSEITEDIGMNESYDSGGDKTSIMFKNSIVATSQKYIVAAWKKAGYHFSKSPKSPKTYDFINSSE